MRVVRALLCVVAAGRLIGRAFIDRHGHHHSKRLWRGCHRLDELGARQRRALVSFWPGHCPGSAPLGTTCVGRQTWLLVATRGEWDTDLVGSGPCFFLGVSSSSSSRSS